MVLGQKFSNRSSTGTIKTSPVYVLLFQDFYVNSEKKETNKL